jgi:cytochrome bd-type quinol oxidase subunit 2
MKKTLKIVGIGSLVAVAGVFAYALWAYWVSPMPFLRNGGKHARRKP